MREQRQGELEPQTPECVGVDYPGMPQVRLGLIAGKLSDGSRVMNRHLSQWFILGALCLCSLLARGQQTNSNLARGAAFNSPSFPALDTPEISHRSGPSVSVRELSIPVRASNAYKKGLDRLAKDDPAGSLVHFQRATSEFQGFYEAYFALGLAQLDLGHEEEAQQAFQKSIDESGGHYAQPLFAMSMLLCGQRKYAEAEPIVRRALELAPGLRPGKLILAWALFGLNHVDQAERIDREVLVQDPTLAPAHLLLSDIYNRRSDYSAALSELDAYLKLKPYGALSGQVREIKKSLEQRLAKSAVIIEATRAEP
jgi:tetratricopeptide (TPR) repeat protein